ncbi:MAG: PD-(D/E)XK nuclease family protein [Comamonadaceae bacterium]|nr:MAG: PD-(D/E)XK nuclease family protein [Comamonadaceae bacterium]
MHEIAKNHHASAAWTQVATRIREALAERNAHPARTVVLVPYAQLMQPATQAWAEASGTAGGSVFLPRFETTMNWAGAEGGFVAEAQDVTFDTASDILTAASLLDTAGLAQARDALAARLVEAAHDLARLAAAVPPAGRQGWSDRMRKALLELPGGMMDAPILKLEAAVAQIALAWAASSSYPSDVLFEADLDCFVLLEGFQSDPLGQSLLRHFGARAFSLPIPVLGAPLEPALRATANSEDEAARAAACVLRHLAAGRAPVALVAQDRALTRRIRATLAARGVRMRDETGWTLSTTRAAAQLMSLLRAAARDASADTVLDWLKNAPAFDAAAVTSLEILLRRNGVRDWRGVSAAHAVAGQANTLREALQPPRPLSRWLSALRDALHLAGQWDALSADAAGDMVLAALRLHEGAEAEFSHVHRRMDLRAFTSWVNTALEAGNFKPVHPRDEHVVILPLSQLLGRVFGAVVLPGADEARLAVSPEPTGAWTKAQRLALGLPSREDMAAAARAAWNNALRAPCLDVLWRESEGGEHLLPSGFVQELELAAALPRAADPQDIRNVTATPLLPPLPVGQLLPVQLISASAYGDLRACPYRFFALRQLRLSESDELESELGKRDFGNWLHTLLKIFHERLKAEPVPDGAPRLALINDAAQEATQELALSQGEFLPFAAAWPQVRDGYLHWLARHEATGARFDEAEAEKRQPLGDITLFGRIDRIDRLSDGSSLVIDYKTEGRATTAARIKTPLEDTQLAFYAALLPDDELRAAYVNLGERDETRAYEQEDVVAARDALVEGILADMRNISAGAPLPALGEASACEYCSARGLCRKDFWSVEEGA